MANTFKLPLRSFFICLTLTCPVVWADFDFNTGVDSTTGFVNAYHMDVGTFSTAMYNYRVVTNNYWMDTGGNLSNSSSQPPPQSSDGGKVTKVPAGKRVSKTTINRMASAVPASVREQIKPIYEKLFPVYLQLEKNLGIPKYDMAGAVAAYIAGNYIAYYGLESVTDSEFLVLAQQIRGALKGNRILKKMKAAKKRQLYEQLAITGIFMTSVKIVLLQQPNAEYTLGLQEAARKYLENVFNVSINQIGITSNGLEIQ